MSEATTTNRLNWNWVALGILIIAYIFSVSRFLVLSAQNESTSDKKIIRIAHWQLEPGYRDALDWAMNQYNNLPHVQEAGVKVEQIPLPTRVYNQFMNVHLISGTAPDIAAAGFTSMIQGNAIARFYASLGDYVNEPNPYNAQQYLDESIDPNLREYLAHAPWKETFLDGMEGGWRQELNDYFSVPISNIGGLRNYYNLTLVQEGKAFIRQAMQQNASPDWLQNCWLRQENGRTEGYLPDNQRLHEWLEDTQAVPRTLGQFILFCYAIEAMAQEQGIEHLVPISAGNSPASDPIYRYQPGFFRLLGNRLEQDGAAGLTGLEAMDGLARGDWSLNDSVFQQFVELSRTLVQFYPAGFQGLDREQVQRRFVSGDAALFSSGSWDAAGVFKATQQRTNEQERFLVAIAPVPLPAPDERWGDMLDYLPSEANFRTGVPLSINKQSENFQWALDFLMYISSQPVNEEFNQIAAWLPATVGAETTESMRDFEPIIEGYPGYETFDPFQARSNIRGQWKRGFDQVVIGAMSLEQFEMNMLEYLKQQHKGLPGYWWQDWLSAKDKSRALDRNLAVEEFNQALSPNEQTAQRFRSLYYQSLTDDEGVHLEMMWHNLHRGEPFPNLE